MSRSIVAPALRLAAAGSLAALLAACGGSDGPTGPGGRAGDGSFSATLAAQGSASRQLTGGAFWGQSPANAEPAFLIAMGPLTQDKDDFREMISFSRGNRSVPAAGTYPIFDITGDEEPGANDFALVGVVKDAAGHDMVCTGVSGSLVVQSTSGSRVKGSYNATALCLSTGANDAVEVTLTGQFDAVNGGAAGPLFSVRPPAATLGAAFARLPR